MSTPKLKSLLPFLLILLMTTGIVIIKPDPHSENELQITVNNILSPYSAVTLSNEEAITIQQAFRKAELKGGPELDNAIKTAGFDPGVFKQPPPPLNEPNGNKAPVDQQHPGRVFESLATQYGPEDFRIFSDAVNERNELLPQYRCEFKEDGIEKSIPVRWENVPENTQSLAVVMYHFPNAEDHAHANSYLLLWHINPEVTDIPYGMAETGDWFMGSNKDGDAVSYTSPCSHSPGAHSYTMAIFALAETPAALPKESSVAVDFETFMTAIESTPIVGKAELSFTDNNH